MNYTENNYIVRGGHYVVCKTPPSTAGHPKDMVEVCVKCNSIIAHLHWNGKVHVRREAIIKKCEGG